MWPGPAPSPCRMPSWPAPCPPERPASTWASSTSSSSSRRSWPRSASARSWRSFLTNESALVLLVGGDNRLTVVVIGGLSLAVAAALCAIVIDPEADQGARRRPRTPRAGLSTSPADLRQRADTDRRATIPRTTRATRLFEEIPRQVPGARTCIALSSCEDTPRLHRSRVARSHRLGLLDPPARGTAPRLQPRPHGRPAIGSGDSPARRHRPGRCAARSTPPWPRGPPPRSSPPVPAGP